MKYLDSIFIAQNKITLNSCFVTQLLDNTIASERKTIIEYYIMICYSWMITILYECNQIVMKIHTV